MACTGCQGRRDWIKARAEKARAALRDKLPAKRNKKPKPPMVA